jgi:hypothetical protein
MTALWENRMTAAKGQDDSFLEDWNAASAEEQSDSIDLEWARRGARTS